MPDIGINQWAVVKVGGGSDALPGLVTGGSINGDPNVQARDSISGRSVNVGGSMVPGGNITLMVQNEAIFTTAGTIKRTAYTAPALTSLEFEGGTSTTKWRHTSCYTDSITFSSAIDEALVADWSWLGTGEAAGTSTWPAASTDLPFEWFTGAVTVGGALFLAQTMTLTLSNNVRPYYTLDTKADHKRFPDGLIIGSEEVTLSCDVLTWPTSYDAWLFADDIVRDIAASFAFTGGEEAGDSITFTLANLSCTGIGHPFEAGDGLVVYKLDFVGEKNNSTTLTIA